MQDDILEDEADQPFEPDVDLSDKPWFQANTPDAPDVYVESVLNYSRALASLPPGMLRIMGHQVHK